jgi:hypothetical protein
MIAATHIQHAHAQHAHIQHAHIQHAHCDGCDRLRLASLPL